MLLLIIPVTHTKHIESVQSVLQEIAEVLQQKVQNYRIALYFRGPKLSHLEHAKQFHEMIFTISGMGPHFLESFSYNTLGPKVLATSELAVDIDHDGISLDKRLGKAHLLAPCKNFHGA